MSERLPPDQLPPHSTEIEEALLGSILIDPSGMPDVAQRVTGADFFIVRNGWVWEAMRALFDRGDAIDYATVVHELGARGRLEELGGAAYITWLVNHTPSGLHAGTYAELVARTAYRRSLLGSASDLARLAWAETDAQTIQDQAEALVLEQRQRLPPQDDYLEGSAALRFYASLIRQRVDRSGPEAITLPWMNMAEYVPSIKPGKVVLVSAFSGEGKTIFLEEVAEWAAMVGHKVLYITTELTREDMLDRMVCRHTGLPYDEVVSRNADIQQLLEMLRARVEGWIGNLAYWETNGANARTVFAQISRAAQKGRTVILIDYLSEAIGFNTERRTEKQAIDNFFRTLHSFAKQSRTTVFVASQLRPGDHGPHLYGSIVPHDKTSLHIRLEGEKLKESRIYTVDDRLVPCRKGQFSPMMKAVLEKNTFGKKGTPYLFRDGARFRFLAEGDVSYSTPFTEDQLAEAEKKSRAGSYAVSDDEEWER
jgi:replicative DNA helicase